MNDTDGALWRCWAPGQRAAHAEYESILNATPAAERLRACHDMVAFEPHIAGTDGDRRVIARLVEAFEAMGLEVRRHDLRIFLSRPIEAALEIISPAREALALQETALEEDPDTGHPQLTFGHNAFSGSGEVRGEVVYANHGTKEDFDTLRELGVNVTGRIVIARYGANYRGYKAEYAQAAGAAGLIIYTDPEDSGYRRGLPYPEGGWANETSIQRGSLLTLPQPGDVLTPFEDSVDPVSRLEPDEVGLPRIPVQPIGWAAAQRIMSQMTGRALPQEMVDRWQGGLPLAYRLEGGPDLRLRLMVRQERRLAETASVIATLPGAVHADELVIIGCHHDAWGFGAGDPLSGLISLLESARSFTEAARQGRRPDRTLVFAAWGAEEHGIIGSTEFCKSNHHWLTDRTVAYINLDMASMGTDFYVSAAPLLKQLITEAARSVPQARGENGQTVHDAWTDDGENEPRFGDLGGGSDHVGFYCHLGIPSAQLGAHGSPGVSYHTNYDTLRWYRQVVGEDYEPALMIARMTNTIAARLAGASLLPLDPAPCASDARRHLGDLSRRAGDAGIELDLEALNAAIDGFENAALPAWESVLDALEGGRLDDERMEAVNAILRALERHWILDEGLTGRPWYRNLFAATDPTSGYSAWMLPELRAAIEAGGEPAAAVARYAQVFQTLASEMGRLRSLADGGRSAP